MLVVTSAAHKVIGVALNFDVPQALALTSLLKLQIPVHYYIPFPLCVCVHR